MTTTCDLCGQPGALVMNHDTSHPGYAQVARRCPQHLPAMRQGQATRGVRCYSDHNEDIRTKGACDYCGSDEVDA